VQAGPSAPAAPQVTEDISQQPQFPQMQHHRIELPEAHVRDWVQEHQLLTDLGLLSQASSRATELRYQEPMQEIRPLVSCYP
jgi:hypothetical protein